MNDSEPSKAKRRWYQFSLWTLLVVVTLAGLWCSLIAVEAHHDRRRQKVLDDLQRLGVRFLRAHSDLILQSPRDFGDKHMGLLGEWDDLSKWNTSWGLRLNDTEVTDAGLIHLKGRSRLNMLDLTRTHISDAGLKHLTGLAGLEILSLQETQVTDSGLEHLKEMANLRRLFLGSTPITGRGLKHLNDLPELEYLSLRETQLTDSGLQHLRELTSLQELYLADTQITDAGVKKLKEALPNCQIIR